MDDKILPFAVNENRPGGIATGAQATPRDHEMYWEVRNAVSAFIKEHFDADEYCSSMILPLILIEQGCQNGVHGAGIEATAFLLDQAKASLEEILQNQRDEGIQPLWE